MRINKYIVGAGITALGLVALHLLMPPREEVLERTLDLDAAQIQSVFTYDLPPLPIDARADACLRQIRPLKDEPYGEEHVVACRLSSTQPDGLTPWVSSLAGEQGAVAAVEIPPAFELPPVGSPFVPARAWSRLPLGSWGVYTPLAFTNAEGTEGVVYFKVEILQ